MRYRIRCPMMTATVQSLDVALRLIADNRGVPGWEPLELNPTLEQDVSSEQFPAYPFHTWDPRHVR